MEIPVIMFSRIHYIPILSIFYRTKLIGVPKFELLSFLYIQFNIKYPLSSCLQILGILVIVFGVLILNSIGMIEVDGQTGFPPQAAMPIGMITIGSIVVFISFLGCCGAIREDVCMTMCYAVLMLILLIIQLIVVVLLWTNQDKIETAMDNVIESAWQSEVREAGVFEVVQKSVSNVSWQNDK